MASRAVIAVVVSAVFMSNLDLWIVNVALPDIGHGFGGQLSTLSWVLNAYAVTLAALLIPAGRLGDRVGHRAVFLTGIALFTLASVACAAAPDLGVLVAARIMQAAGAAAQLPTSLALLMAAVPADRRTAAARGWAAVGALSAVLGPVAGGLLVTASWRWVFLVNLPIGVVSFVAGRRVLPHPPGDERDPLPDLIGSGLLVASVAALTAAMVEAPDWGWTGGRTLALYAVTVVAGGAFLRRCARHPVPMIELPLLRVRGFGVANAAAFVFSVAFAIMLLSNSLWCQEVWHYSALRTGLAMVPGPAMVPVVTFGSTALVHRIGPGPVAAAGGILFGASLLWRVALAGPTPDYARDLLPSMLIGGVGVGLALSTLIAAGATALPAHRAATGSAMVNSSRQVASSLGVALLVTLLASAVNPTRGFDIAWIAGAVIAVAAGVISLALPRPARATT